MTNRLGNRMRRYEVAEEYANQYQQEHPEEYYEEPQYQYDEDNRDGGFGDTRIPVNLAKEIEKKPVPAGHDSIIIGGRPVDLHMFEDYLVWKTSPYQLKTLLRYHNARTIEEIKNYGRGPTFKMKSGLFIILIFIIFMAIIGIALIFYLPDIMNMFQSGF